MFFKNKEREELKAEILNLQSSLFAAQNQLADAKLAIKDCRDTIESYGNKCRTSDDLIDKQRKRIAELEKLVREQSSADLLLNALQAVGIAKEMGDPTNTHVEAAKDINRRIALAKSQAQAAQPSYGLYAYGLGNNPFYPRII